MHGDVIEISGRSACGQRRCGWRSSDGARGRRRSERLLEEAERAQRAGDFAAAAVALRNHLDDHPDDHRSRLRFASVLIALGERGRARGLLAPLEGGDDDEAIRREAVRRLAELDEAEGAVIAAAERWEKLLADDIDDPQARTHLALLRPARSDVDIDPSQTLVSPAGIETLRFRLLREVGRGATATVYLARDEALHLDVALKVLHPQLSGSGRSDSLRRFFADARVAAAVRHPGVVAIYDVDEAARAVAMEWIAGGTLRQRLREHPGGLPTAELRATARSLLGAVRYVHAAGIVHGDLKPSQPAAARARRRGARRFRDGGADRRRRVAPPVPPERRSTSPPSNSRARPARRPPISTRRARSSGRPRPAGRYGATPT